MNTTTPSLRMYTLLEVGSIVYVGVGFPVTSAWRFKIKSDKTVTFGSKK